MLVAGGLNVAQTLSTALAIPFSQWGDESLPRNFNFCDLENLPSYIWEVIRFFQPIPTFAYIERSYGTKPDQTVFLSLQMAQRDPRVWGEEADDFRPRPIEVYHRHSVGFAEPADGPEFPKGMARSCPAIDLSMVIITTFLGEFIRTVIAAGGEATSKDSHRSVWAARAAEPDKNGHRHLLDPSEVKVYMLGCSHFALCRVQASSTGNSDCTSSAEDGKDVDKPNGASLAKSGTPIAPPTVFPAKSLCPPPSPADEAISSAASQRTGKRVLPKGKGKPKK